MRRVNRSRYVRAPGERKPSLKGDDLRTGSEIVTVADVEAVELPDNRTGRMRDALRITFTEYPDHHWWPNAGSCDILFAELGDDLDSWQGQKVAVHRVRSSDPFDARAVESEKVWCQPRDQWAAALAPAAGAGAAKAPRKRKA